MARGSVKQRTKGSWFIRVELEPDPLTGKRRQKAETFVGNKRDADTRLSELLGKARQGTIGNAGRLTVGEYLDRWLTEHAEANLSPRTTARYRVVVARQIKPYVGRVQFDKLRPSHVLDFKTALRAATKTQQRRKARAGAPASPDVEPAGPLAPLTQRKAFRVLFTALEHAVAWKLISSNPAATITAPAATAPEMKTWTAEQSASFVAASECQGLAWQAFFNVALNTGMRLAELTGLRWQDVDLASGVVRVRQTVAYVSGAGLVVKPPKTAASRRSIPIGASLVALLRRHRAVQNELRLASGPAWRDHDLVFPSSVGTPVQEYIVRKVLARICAVAEVPIIRVHDIRHTAATLMLIAGVNPKVVSERLGHATIAITLQTYTHVLPTMQQDAANLLESLLNAGPAKPRDQSVIRAFG